MSLLIKGMDMPGKCQYCPCCYHDEEDPTPKATCSVWGDSIPDMTAGRIDECPLIELHLVEPKGKQSNLKDLRVTIHPMTNEVITIPSKDKSRRFVRHTVICPLYKSSENKPSCIRCEGMNNTILKIQFQSSEERREHEKHYCCSRFRLCPYATWLK